MSFIEVTDNSNLTGARRLLLNVAQITTIQLAPYNNLYYIGLPSGGINVSETDFKRILAMINRR